MKQIYTDVERTGTEEYIFVGVISQGNEEKIVTGKVCEHTDNRAIIMTLVQLFGDFEEKEELQIYTKTNFGFKYLCNTKKWVNKDVGEKLAQIIEQKQLEVVFYNYNDTEKPELKWIQAMMKKYMQEYYVATKKNKTGHLISRQLSEEVGDKISVDLYIRGECDTTKVNRPGRYASALKCKGKEKVLFGEEENTTSNRMIITGCIEALKVLNKSCKVNLFTHTNMGLKKGRRANKGVNGDLLEELYRLLDEGNHSIEENISSEWQEELKQIIREKSNRQVV